MIREKDLNKVRKNLEYIDTFGEDLGYGAKRAVKYVTSKILVSLYFLLFSVVVLIFSMINGVRKGRKNEF